MHLAVVEVLAVEDSTAMVEVAALDLVYIGSLLNVPRSFTRVNLSALRSGLKKRSCKQFLGVCVWACVQVTRYHATLLSPDLFSEQA